jgi:hypothetical protein
MPPEYVTVYQISRESTDWGFALVGLIPLIVGIALAGAKRRFKWEKPHSFFPIFACGFGFLWLCTVGFSVLHEDSEAYTAFQRHNYEVVEGVVYDFHPMPYEGHQEECFSVQQQQFCYSDYVVAPGFRNTTSHGGPIRAGLPVRIAYSGGAILRLEVAKGPVPTQAKSIAAANSAQQAMQQRWSNAPFQQRLKVAFIFTMVCWTLWWNLQWKRVMRFWLRPPNREWVQYLFRAFFAVNFLSALWQLGKQLHERPPGKQEIVPTLEVALIMCGVVALMSASVLWFAERRDRDKLLTDN